MKAPRELSSFDFDTVMRYCGHDMESVPEATADNMQKLVEAHNELVVIVNLLCKMSGIVTFEE